MGPLAPVKYRTVHFGIRGEILNQQKNITNEKSRLVASQFLGLRPWVITLEVCLRIELVNYFHFGRTAEWSSLHNFFIPEGL